MFVDFATVTLFSGTITTPGTTNGASVPLPPPRGGIVYVFDLTAAATDVGDTFDVTVQVQVGTDASGNAVWADVVHFTQVLGNGGTKTFVAKTTSDLAQALFDNSVALTAGNVRHIFGSNYRVVAALVDAGTQNASFTFTVKAKVF